MAKQVVQLIEVDKINIGSHPRPSRVVDGAHPPSQESGEEKTNPGKNVQDIRCTNEHNPVFPKHSPDFSNELSLMFDVLDDFH